jgi:hypothetical protein
VSWSYTVSDLATVQKDQVRWLIGDTLTNDQQLEDEEISFALTQRANVWGAAALCCGSLATRMSRQADAVQGETRTMYSSRARAYAVRGAHFENQAMARVAFPYAGGISFADKSVDELNADRVPPEYTIGMDDNFSEPYSAGDNNETISAGEGEGV